MKSLLGAYTKKPAPGTAAAADANAPKKREEPAAPTGGAEVRVGDDDERNSKKSKSDQQPHRIVLPSIDSDADDEFAPPPSKVAKRKSACTTAPATRLTCCVRLIAEAPSPPTRGTLPPSAAIGFVPPQVRRGKPNASTEDLTNMGFTKK